MRTFIATLLILLVSFSADAQDRKAERQARREARRELQRIERAIRDSLRLRSQEEDSVNVGYGYVKNKNLTSSVSKVSMDNVQRAAMHISENIWPDVCPVSWFIRPAAVINIRYEELRQYMRPQIHFS